MFMQNAMRGYALGAKHGIMEGIRRYKETDETPAMDETAMQGAIGIIIAVGGVLIALYIIAVVVGSISYAVTSGNIKLSPTWNTTITNLNEVVLTNGRFIGREHRFAGTGDLQSGKCPADRHYRGGHSHDRDRGLLRTWYLNLIPSTISCRTLNTAYA